MINYHPTVLVGDRSSTTVDDSGRNSRIVSIPYNESLNCTFVTSVHHRCSAFLNTSLLSIQQNVGTKYSFRVAVLYNCVMVVPFSDEVSISVTAQGDK